MQVLNQGITAPLGFLAQGVAAAIKKPDREDLAVILAARECKAEAVFTTNRVQAACVKYSKEVAARGAARAVVVNSGNANACTGLQGEVDARVMAQTAAEVLHIDAEEVIVASTGVIGVPMPMERVQAGIKEACRGLSVGGGHSAARAIMTTDTVPKEIAVQVRIDGKPVRIGAMAKGSGMIHPNMATMLGFITTDVNISNECLGQALRDSVDISYNMISVDRDTSTNDMVVVLANGLAGNSLIDNISSRSYRDFKAALDYVNVELARSVAGDGEGATRLIQVEIVNAGSQHAARQIARSITGSNLTKAAVFGQDANWGRIICAAGYAGAEFDPNLVDIYLGEVQVASNGMGVDFDEEKARQTLQQDTVCIRLDMKQGTCAATAWGCDLTHDYININASYRT